MGLRGQKVCCQWGTFCRHCVRAACVVLLESGDGGGVDDVLGEKIVDGDEGEQ